MPIEATIALVAIAVLANVALLRVRGDGSPVASWGETADARATAYSPPPDGAAAPYLPDISDPDPAAAEGDPTLRPAAIHRVVRVATWLFLFAATTVVAAGGLWPDHQGAILGLLAAGAIYQLVIHDALEPRVPGPLLHATGGALAIAFAAFLVGLTGGTTSPFFFAFPLIAGGAALVAAPASAVVLVAAAGASYVVAAAGANGLPFDDQALATLAVNVIALALLAYVAVAIGREQRRARDLAIRIATVDTLTGLRTRAHLFGMLERELIRSQRTGRRFCLLMLDLDDLKRVNDRHGHLAGDAALRATGDVILRGIRRIDTGARYGGDEFVVLLPETDATGGRVLGEKIRRDVAAIRISNGQQVVSTSVSVGVVTFPEDGETLPTLLARADAAMYVSKRAGRDRVTGVPVMDAEATRTGARGNPV